MAKYTLQFTKCICLRGQHYQPHFVNKNERIEAQKVEWRARGCRAAKIQQLDLPSLQSSLSRSAFTSVTTPSLTSQHYGLHQSLSPWSHTACDQQKEGPWEWEQGLRRDHPLFESKLASKCTRVELSYPWEHGLWMQVSWTELWEWKVTIRCPVRRT